MNKSIQGPVLVTGGAGYIGGHAVLALQDIGVEVVVLDDLSTGMWRPFHENATCYEGRVHDQALVKKIIQSHGIRSIMHFAGSIKVDESVEKPLKYYHNNTEGSRCLIEVAAGLGVKNFIFSSTAAVYGATGDDPVNEHFPAKPLNPYGSSKLFTEVQLRDVCAVSDMNYGIFRYFNVAGADPKMRHGQFLEKPVHLIGRAIDAVLGDAPPLKIFGKDLPTRDGTGIRDYIHVSDLVSAHISLLQAMENGSGSLLLNLGYGAGQTVLEVIEALSKVTGQEVPWEYGEPRPGEAPSVYADVELLGKTLDWTPECAGLTQIIGDSFKWACKNKGIIQ